MSGFFSIKTLSSYVRGFIFFIFLPAQAVSAQTAVLPFYVSGNPGIFSVQEGPEFLQEAFHFIFSIQKDYPAVDLYSVNRSLREIGFRGDKILNKNSAGIICRDTGAEYLLTGSADFHGGSGVILSAVSYTCRTGAVEEKKEDGSLKDLQILISRLTNSVSSYARSRPQIKIGEKRKSFNYSVILDMSGSMSSDFPFIEKGLRSAAGNASPGTEMDVYLLRSKNVARMKSAGSLSSVVSRVFQEKPAGRSSKDQLIQALTQIEKDFRRGGTNRLLVFTDVEFSSGRMNDVENKLRALKSRGMEIYLFLLYGQGRSEKSEWKRIARTLGLADPSVVYGRRLGYLEGFSKVFLQDADRFYVSDQDVSSYIIKNTVPDSVQELSFSDFSGNHLNLSDAAALYSRREKLHPGGMGPLVSGLEARIMQSVSGDTAKDTRYYKVLVKNKEKSFWIRIADPRIYSQIKQIQGAFYVGLQFFGGENYGFPENIPEFVYVKKQKDVPRLLVNEWSYISRLPESRIRSGDIWFFLVTAERFDDGRESEDIRK